MDPATTPSPLITGTSLALAQDRGLAWLRDHQYPNGEFCAYSSGDDPMLGWCRPDSTVFPTALIGSCLLPLRGNALADELLRSTALFLRAQMARGGTWNHFTLGHPLRALCPMDADDTACVSALLAALGTGFPADQNTKLLLDNRRTDGLFYTWFAFHLRLQVRTGTDHLALRLRALRNPLATLLFWNKMECGPDDVDAVVNANLLYYLGLNEHTRPVVNYLLDIIAKGGEGDCDKWYRHPLSVYYFIARNCPGGALSRDELAPVLLKRIVAKAAPGGRIGESALHTALAATTLLNLGVRNPLLDGAVAYLLASQQANGSWPRWRLYYGGPSLVNGYGSEELTTAFCLEALARYRATTAAIDSSR